MTAAAIAASSAREMVLVIPMPLGLHSGKYLSEDGLQVWEYYKLQITRENLILFNKLRVPHPRTYLLGANKRC